jgi:hypothetical protein
MADRRGQARALSVMTPITDGRVDALGAVLEGFERGSRSPLAKVPGTHFARWCVIDRLVNQGSPQPPDELRGRYLLFTSNFDGAERPYLEALAARIPEASREVWSNCTGYPGDGDPRALVDWLLGHRIRTHLFVAAYPRATVDQVKWALDQRKRLGEFAISAQGRKAEDLRDSFMEQFASKEVSAWAR